MRYEIDEAGHVIKLELSCGLESIPKEIENLTNLEELYFGEN
ncbi:MAG: hypothetical protein ACTSRG_25880 [Candidatus Helarchaeota archaeon]